MLQQQVDEWRSSIRFQLSVEVLEKAQTALDLVLSDDSELNELCLG